MKKSLYLIMPLTLSLLMTGCGGEKKTSYYAEVTTTTAATTEQEEEEVSKEAVSLKYTSIINANTVSGVAITADNPYYKSQLSEPAQRALEDIVNGMIEYRDYITLGTSITEDELARIMNIIMTNVPDVFHSDFSYKYDLNVSGYIKNFYPVYTMDYASYASIKDSLERSLISYCTNKSVNEYDFLSGVYQSAYNASDNPSVQLTVASDKNGLARDAYISQTIATISKSQTKFTSLGAAKYIQYYCNYMGIENMIVLGELIDNNYNMQGIYLNDDVKTFENDNIYTVKMNINNYHAWNIIKIGGLWVNCDAYLDKYLSKEDSCPYGSFMCVPDEVTRQTRLFQANNDLLGLTPPCTSNNFQYNARQLFFISNYTDEDVLDCVDTFIENLDYNRLESAAIQFQSESGYRKFCELFSDRMALYNQTHNQIMPKFDISERDYVLTFSIDNIVYSEK